MHVKRLVSAALAVLFAAGTPTLAFAASDDAPSKRVLLVLSNVDQLPGVPVATGNYLREVAYPALMLRQAGYVVDFASPKGGAVLVRGNTVYGLPDDRLRDPQLQAFDRDYLHGERLATIPAAEATRRQYDAVFYTASLGGLVDLRRDRTVASIARKVHARGGFIATTGHGAIGLLALRGPHGLPWVARRTVAPFTAAEERGFVIGKLGWKLPFHVEHRLRDAGARIDSGPGGELHVVADGRLFSAQNARSVQAVVELLIRAMERKAAAGMAAHAE